MSRLLLALVLTLSLGLSGCLRRQVAPYDYAADPHAHSTFELDGTMIHYADQGRRDAPPVVMIHGFGSSIRVWNELTIGLTDDRRVVRVDLPGFGRSSRYEDDYSRARLSEVVLALMDHLAIERADLVAHSMGSAIALSVAGSNPDRVGRVVLAAPWTYEDQVPWGLRDARRPGVGEFIFGVWYLEHLDWRFRLSFADPDAWVTEGMVQRARDDLTQPGGRYAALQVVRGTDLETLEAMLGSVEAPVLVVQCDADVVSRPEYARRLASSLAHAELEELTGCGHFPMIERSDRFAALVQGWLQ